MYIGIIDNVYTLWYASIVFKWNPDKNKMLFESRNITFEEVVQAISDGHGISDTQHWNKAKYPRQRIITVLINQYAYIVPYVMDGEDYFLKTIIPSRKANRSIEEKRNEQLWQ